MQAGTSTLLDFGVVSEAIGCRLGLFGVARAKGRVVGQPSGSLCL